MATPSIVTICALWPQQCAAPVSAVGEFVVGHQHGVEFADHADGRPWPRRPADDRLQTGDRDLLVIAEAEALELRRDNAGGAELLEAQFGITIDPLADRDQVLGVAVDLVADALLQFLVPASLIPSCQMCLTSANLVIRTNESGPQAGRSMVAHTGFEPVISALRGRCPRPLDECAARVAQTSGQYSNGV